MLCTSAKPMQNQCIFITPATQASRNRARLRKPISKQVRSLTRTNQKEAFPVKGPPGKVFQLRASLRKLKDFV